MNRYVMLLGLAGALCASAVLAGTLYDWIGEGEDSCWTTEDNWDWDHSVNPHYPGSADEARMGWPYGYGPWTCGLETKDVLSLEIWDDITFEACETSPILTAGQVLIIGPDVSGQSVTVSMSGGRIVTSEN
jgi:hypothetical protein